MAEPQHQLEPRGALDHALELMTKALKALDKGGAPADIGARLDQVVTRLSQVISISLEVNRSNPEGLDFASVKRLCNVAPPNPILRNRYATCTKVEFSTDAVGEEGVERAKIATPWYFDG